MPTRTLTLIIAVFACCAPVAAHHGFGLFDMNKEVNYEGTLTGIDFVNPHSYVYFDVTGTGGTVTKMRCEMRAATVLRRSGWSAGLFITGARIVIAGHPHRDDPASCYTETIAIGDAPTLVRYQQLDKHAASGQQPSRPLRLASGEPNIAGEWAQEQYLLAHPPGGTGPGRLVPKSLLDAVNSGKLKAEDAPDAGWRPSPVTLTDAGKQASDAFRNLPPDQKPNTSCQITSILFDWVFDGPINRITQSRELILLEYGRGLKRTVRMDQDHHPEDIEPSRAGHSIGRWEGDTLVIDTVGFKPGIISGTIPNSGEFHVVERFTLNPGTLALKREYTATDPQYFTGNYTGSDTVLPADAPFAVDQCKELASEYTKPDAGAVK